MTSAKKPTWTWIDEGVLTVDRAGVVRLPRRYATNEATQFSFKCHGADRLPPRIAKNERAQ